MGDHPLDEVPDLIFDPRVKPAKAVRFPPNSVFAVDSRPAEIMSPKSNFKVGIVYSPSGEKKPSKEETTQEPVSTSEAKDSQTDVPFVAEKPRPVADLKVSLNDTLDRDRSFGVNEYGIDDYGMREQWSKFKMDIANLRNLPRATGRSVFYPSSEVYYQDSFDPFSAYDESWSRYKGGTRPNLYGTDYANLTQKQLDLLRESIELEKRRRHDLESKIFEVEAKSRFDMEMAKRVYSRSALDRATAGRGLDRDTVPTIANPDTRKLISQFESALDEERAAAKNLKSSIDELKTDLNLSRSIWLSGRVPRRYYVCCSSDYCNCTRRHTSVDWQKRLENHQRALWEKKQEEQKRVASLTVPTFASFDASPTVAVKNLNQFNAQLDSMKDQLERLKVSAGKGACAPVDHWCTVPPSVGCTCDPTCCTCWKAQLRHIQSQQWESYSKIRDNTFY